MRGVLDGLLLFILGLQGSLEVKVKFALLFQALLLHVTDNTFVHGLAVCAG